MVSYISGYVRRTGYTPATPLHRNITHSGMWNARNWSNTVWWLNQSLWNCAEESAFPTNIPSFGLIHATNFTSVLPSMDCKSEVKSFTNNDDCKSWASFFELASDVSDSDLTRECCALLLFCVGETEGVCMDNLLVGVTVIDPRTSLL